MNLEFLFGALDVSAQHTRILQPNLLLILLNRFRHIAPSAHLRQHSFIHIYPAPPQRPPSMTSFLLLPTSSA